MTFIRKDGVLSIDFYDYMIETIFLGAFITALIYQKYSRVLQRKF